MRLYYFQMIYICIFWIESKTIASNHLQKIHLKKLLPKNSLLFSATFPSGSCIVRTHITHNFKKHEKKIFFYTKIEKFGFFYSIFIFFCVESKLLYLCVKIFDWFFTRNASELNTVTFFRWWVMPDAAIYSIASIRIQIFFRSLIFLLYMFEKLFYFLSVLYALLWLRSTNTRKYIRKYECSD